MHFLSSVLKASYYCIISSHQEVKLWCLQSVTRSLSRKFCSLLRSSSDRTFLSKISQWVVYQTCRDKRLLSSHRAYLRVKLYHKVLRTSLQQVSINAENNGLKKLHRVDDVADKTARISLPSEIMWYSGSANGFGYSGIRGLFNSGIRKFRIRV